VSIIDPIQSGVLAVLLSGLYGVSAITVGGDS
jgi:hypothetical protein